MQRNTRSSHKQPGANQGKSVDIKKKKIESTETPIVVEADEITPLSEQNSVSSNAEKTIYFVQLFPEFTQKQFKELTEKHKDSKHSVPMVINGFKMTYDPTIADPYTRYHQHYKETMDAIENHKHQCIHSHTKNKVVLKRLEVLQLPKEPSDLTSVQEQLSKLTPDDEVYLNAHGNQKLMGIGSMTMEPKEIALAIQNLNISKDHPPHIILWSCNSANEEGQKALADKVKEELVKLHFQSPMVTGATNLLFNKSSGVRSYVGERYEGRNGVKKIKPVPLKESLKSYSTPNTKKVIDEARIPSGARLYTRNIHNTKLRARRFAAAKVTPLMFSPPSKGKAEIETKPSPVEAKTKTQKQVVARSIYASPEQSKKAKTRKPITPSNMVTRSRAKRKVIFSPRNRSQDP